jgi:hypothetical protein
MDRTFSVVLLLLGAVISASAYSPYCTYSQGGYGTTCPNSNPANHPGCIRDVCFPLAFPSGIRIGTRSWTSSAQVDSFLPATASNVIIGQTLALTLSIGFDRVTTASCRNRLLGTASGQGALAQVQYTGTGPLAGATFAAITAAATAMLNAGQTSWVVNSQTVTSSQFNTALDAINTGLNAGNKFHECIGTAHAVQHT